MTQFRVNGTPETLARKSEGKKKQVPAGFDKWMKILDGCKKTKKNILVTEVCHQAEN